MSNTKKLSKSVVQELANLLLASVDDESYEDSAELVEECDCDCEHACSHSQVDEGVLGELFDNHSKTFSSLDLLVESAKNLEKLHEEVDSAVASLENALVSELDDHVDNLRSLSENLAEGFSRLNEAVEDSLHLFDEGHFLLQSLSGSDDTE